MSRQEIGQKATLSKLSPIIKKMKSDITIKPSATNIIQRAKTISISKNTLSDLKVILLI